MNILLSKISEYVESHERATANILVFCGFAYVIFIYADKQIGFMFNVVNEGTDVVVSDYDVERIKEKIKDMCNV
jgi:hypothetical protein